MSMPDVIYPVDSALPTFGTWYAQPVATYDQGPYYSRAAVGRVAKALYLSGTMDGHDFYTSSTEINARIDRALRELGEGGV
ncbi:MAG: hypothetical protein HY749_15985 [Gammaproteobacteria bacterium]|nr:hypothetical protein [Gammaproteobacteria bacterium]